MSNNKTEELNKEELKNVDGGRVSPTWIPVDESCCECNCGNECAFPSRRGRYDNCCDCKHNK